MKNSKFPHEKSKSENQKLKPKVQKPKPVFAKKSFGQNFLTDERYINKIISALDPQTSETIIEIGAGRGALTEKLIESGANIIAIELEREMIAVLKEKFAGRENFQLVESDVLKTDFSSFSVQNSSFKVKLVANLPYYISTAILQKLIEQRESFLEMILMFQREVVERITAEVGNSERGFLTVLTEAYLQADKLFDVPPDAFQPAPKVWSAVVRLVPKTFELKSANENIFREMISVAFKQKRKTLINNLTGNVEFMKKYSLDKNKILMILSDLKIEATKRAETLTISEWEKLFNSIYRSDK